MPNKTQLGVYVGNEPDHLDRFEAYIMLGVPTLSPPCERARRRRHSDPHRQLRPCPGLSQVRRADDRRPPGAAGSVAEHPGSACCATPHRGRFGDRDPNACGWTRWFESLHPRRLRSCERLPASSGGARWSGRSSATAALPRSSVARPAPTPASVTRGSAPRGAWLEEGLPRRAAFSWRAVSGCRSAPHGPVVGTAAMRGRR